VYVQIIISSKVDDVLTVEKCDIRSFIRELRKSRNNRKVFNYYRIGFFNGIVTSVLDRTVFILIMIVFGSTLQLGILSTVFAVFTITTGCLMNRFYKKEKAKSLIIISAIMPMFAVIMLCVETNTMTVIFYKAVNAVFICILNLIASIERYDCLNEEIMKKFTAEHQEMSELSLAAGRIFGLSVLLVVSSLIYGLYAISV